MSRDISRALHERYPALFPEPFPLECGAGWAGLLSALSATLVELAEAERRQPTPPQQVKEKFGGLRWYYPSHGSESGAVALAGALSHRTCELCGAPGRLAMTATGWYRTLCPAHLVDDRPGVPPGAYRFRDASDASAWLSDSPECSDPP